MASPKNIDALRFMKIAASEELQNFARAAVTGAFDMWGSAPSEAIKQYLLSGDAQLREKASIDVMSIPARTQSSALARIATKSVLKQHMTGQDVYCAVDAVAMARAVVVHLRKGSPSYEMPSTLDAFAADKQVAIQELSELLERYNT